MAFSKFKKGNLTNENQTETRPHAEAEKGQGMLKENIEFAAKRVGIEPRQLVLAMKLVATLECVDHRMALADMWDHVSGELGDVSGLILDQADMVLDPPPEESAEQAAIPNYFVHPAGGIPDATPSEPESPAVQTFIDRIRSMVRPAA
jgi:hypothetical protein